MNKKSKLTRSNISLILCLALAGLLGTTVIYTLINIHNDYESSQIAESESKLSAISEDTTTFLKTAEIAVTTYARNIEFIMNQGVDHDGLYDYLVNETNNSLKQIRSEGDFTGLYGYYEINGVGKYLDGNEWIPDESYDPTARPWYIAAAEAPNHQVAMASPYVDLSFDDNRIVLSVTKMLSDGKSVFGMDIKLDYLQNNIFNLVDPNDFDYTYIINDKGTIVASQVKTSDGKQSIDERARNYINPSLSEYPDAQDVYGMKGIFESVLNNEDILEIEIDGVNQFVFSRTILNGWKIIICTKKSSIISSIDQTFVFAMLLVGLFFLFLLYFLIASFIERHKRETIEKLERDNYEHLENYKNAILHDALIYLETNLTTGELITGKWKDDNGNDLRLSNILGIECPCKYDEYIVLWRQKFVAMSSNISFTTNSDRKTLLEKYSKGITEITFDYEALTVSGKKTWLRRAISMIKNSDGDIIGYTSVKDINDLVQANKRNETYIEALATEYDSIAIIYFNDNKTEDKISFHSKINENLLKYFPKPALEEINFSKRLEMLSEIIHIEDRENFINSTRRENIMNTFENNESLNVTFRIDVENDECIYYQDCFIPLRDEDNDIVGMVSCLRNIDKEIKTELGIRNELEKAMKKAENASQTKTRFLFNMSHDIRTPMNAILGFTQIAKKNLQNSDYVKDCLEKIDLSGQQLLLLINEVLEMSRIESGNIQVEYEPANITDIFTQIAPMFDAQSATKNINFSTEIKKLSNEFVHLDVLHTSRIIANLISNAIKYTPNGGKVVATTEQLNEATNGYATYKFTIADNGIGMSEEFLKHMFEEFAREKSTTLSKQTGTGLGLSIVKRLSDLLGGKITVKSKVNEGSTFEFILDLKVETPEEIKVNHYKKEEDNDNKNTYSLKGRRVMLVEDNELNREIAKTVLEEQGLIIESAENGEIALNMYKSKEFGYYDIILMDIQMPVMDGYQATTKIREYENNKHHVSIIAVSANAFEEDKAKSIEIGMDGHIAKPINVEELISTMEKALKN